MSLTGKQVSDELRKERYDQKGLHVIFHSPTGEKYKISGIEIDEMSHQIVLTSDGMIQGTGPSDDNDN